MATRVVLVVDDDPDVLQIAATVLMRAGLNVIIASNANDALEVIGSEQALDLLFTDIVMPGGPDGFVLAHQAVRIRPELKIVYTSGYTNEVPRGRSGVGYGPLIKKPWRPKDVADEIVRMLT